MFWYDFFEGLCVGHAPKKCRICCKWFLTTNARHTKYCGGYAPGDKLRRTCRQIGNLKGREQRELAADHPLKQIYEKRLNTIKRYVKRGTLNADLAEIMKKLAKDKMLRFRMSEDGEETDDVLHLADFLIDDDAIHPIHLKQKFKKSRKKKIAAAIYEYQVDHDGEWGELSLNFEAKTAEIIRLADWDTIKSNKYAKAAISYLLYCKNENLP